MVLEPAAGDYSRSFCAAAVPRRRLKTETFAATPAEELVDYPDVLFSSRDELPSALSVDERPDIASFGFDLGGSTCACLLHWDVKQYWQQVP